MMYQGLLELVQNLFVSFIKAFGQSVEIDINLFLLWYPFRQLNCTSFLLLDGLGFIDFGFLREQWLFEVFIPNLAKFRITLVHCIECI